MAKIYYEKGTKTPPLERYCRSAIALSLPYSHAAANCGMLHSPRRARDTNRIRKYALHNIKIKLCWKKIHSINKYKQIHVKKINANLNQNILFTFKSRMLQDLTKIIQTRKYANTIFHGTKMTNEKKITLYKK